MEDKLGILSKKDYYCATKLAITTSIDILLFYKDKLLLGRRINNPAKNTLFTPGGRIHKGETVSVAIKRIAKIEFGLNINLKDLEFVNIFQHFYKNNFLDNKHATHYLNLAYKYKINNKEEIDNILKTMKHQHLDIKWLSIDEMLNNKNVNKYVKKYFKKDYNLLKDNFVII